MNTWPRNAESAMYVLDGSSNDEEPSDDGKDAGRWALSGGGGGGGESKTARRRALCFPSQAGVARLLFYILLFAPHFLFKLYLLSFVS